MKPLYYDFHIHSCLSPCADNDMTPNNIAGTAVLAGIDVMALTDHNTLKNCPAFFSAAKRNGIIPIAGAEVTTSEDIHVVCLFEALEAGMEFDLFLDSKRIKIPNRADIFGEQLILDENDEVISTDGFLLSNATGISIDNIAKIVSSYNGVAYPAHVDRQSNSVTAVLGAFPDDPNFTCAEFHDKTKIDTLEALYPEIRTRKKIVSSDAHFLWDIRDKDNKINIDTDPSYPGEAVREIIKNLRTESCR